MSEKKGEILARFEDLTREKIDDRIQKMSGPQLEAVDAMVEDILHRERAGLDSLFSSMTHTMKYIPNLLLQTLTARYIEPPIAARISEKLSSKQAIGVANGLKPEYVAETYIYMSVEKAAELLVGMNRKKAAAAIDIAMRSAPHSAVELMEHLNRSQLKALVKRDQLSKIDAPDLRDRSEHLALMI